MTLPDLSTFVGCSKDFLHAEWASFKKDGVAGSCPVCIYSMGGEDDIPAACLESIGNGFKVLEKVLRDVIYLSVDINTPVIKEDVMVWANGQITLFPPRKSPVKEEEPATSTANDLPPPPIPGKKRKPPQTPEAAFMGGVEQVSNYMLDHLKRISESCLLAGNIKVLYYILSSCVLIKSRVMTYKKVLKAPNTNTLTTAMNRCNETIEVMTQHLLNYHSDLIRSSILHDTSSHDWTAEKAYEENEKISLSIQMWSFYMQGIRNDLWRYTSSKVGENMFNSIFVDTLGLLVTRYIQAKPSDVRLPQMRGDIAAIFLITVSFLPSLIPTPRFFFRGDIHSSIVFAIHRRMDLLLKVAALKCAPIQILAKVYCIGVQASEDFSTNTKEPTEIVSCPSWLTFFNSKLFPPNTKELSTLPDNVAVYLTLFNAAMKPYPNEGIILRGLFMRKLLATKTILKGLQELPSQVDKGKPCGGTLCTGHLCTPPVIPHTVYAGILQILLETYKSPHILTTLLEASIKESGQWDALDRKQVWNIQRPPWHHALVQIVGLYIAPVVCQVLQSVPVVPPAQPAHPSQLSVRLEHHLSAWTLQLINGVSNLADTLPVSLIQLSHAINTFLPPTIKPVGGHIISQLVISAIYSIVNSRSSLDQLCASGAITDGQWDMMIAVGERLCSLHDGNYDQGLEQMTKALLEPLANMENVEDENLDDYTNEEAIEDICQQLADHVMSSEQGKHSFGIVWEYLKRNMEWIGHALNAPPLLPPATSNPEGPPKVKYTPRMSFSNLPQIYNPLKYYKRIFFTLLNHEYLMNFEADWESVLEGDLWMPTEMIRNIIKQRPEMQKDAVLSPSEAEAVETLHAVLKD